MLDDHDVEAYFSRRFEEKGRKEGLQTAAIELARTKLGNLPADDEARIRRLRDSAVLTELILALGRAVDAAEARAAFEDLTRRGA